MHARCTWTEWTRLTKGVTGFIQTSCIQINIDKRTGGDHFLPAAFLLGERFTVLRATGDFLGEAEEVRFLFGEATFLSTLPQSSSGSSRQPLLAGDFDRSRRQPFLPSGRQPSLHQPCVPFWERRQREITAIGEGRGWRGPAPRQLSSQPSCRASETWLLGGRFLGSLLASAFFAILAFFTPATLLVDGDFLAAGRPTFLVSGLVG